MSQDHSSYFESVARARAVKASTFGVLCDALRTAQARRVVDLGCGVGAMAAKLAGNGFELTGVDPSETVLEQARARAPEVDFRRGVAEKPPADLHGFDAAYFLNSLHHVPAAHMREAVVAALSVVRPGGIVVVVEPLAMGSYFRVMRPVEDETAIRALAAQAVDGLIADGVVELLDLRRWDQDISFRALDDMITSLVRVDPAREASVTSNASLLAKAWRENVSVRENKAFLTQPFIAWILARRQSLPA